MKFHRSIPVLLRNREYIDYQDAERKGLIVTSMQRYILPTELGKIEFNTRITEVKRETTDDE